MKTERYILALLALICLLGTGSYAWTLCDAYRGRVSEWDKEAEACFEEALWMEVNKRADMPVSLSVDENVGVTTLRDKMPDSVSVMTLEGFRKYKMDKDKYERSLIKDARQRTVLSVLLSLRPMSIDSLAAHWDSLLSVRDILANHQIRYVTTGLNLQNDTVYSEPENPSSLHLDSLTVRYLGFRCEHELVAYASYPSWLHSLSLAEKILLFLPWVLLGLAMAFYTRLKVFFRRKLVKEKVVEKEVHVADVKIDQAKTFLLPDGSVFDSFSGMLTKGDVSRQLPPQSIVLLKLFLRKENHQLSPAEIERDLWNGKGTTDQLHKAIQRLRGDLKKVSSEVVIKNIHGVYALKLPNPSVETLETEADEAFGQ